MYETYGIDAEQQLKQESAQLKMWREDLQLAAQLNEGIQRGELFKEYRQRTGCPAFLEAKYLELQKRSGIAPHSVKESKPDPFLDGFNA